MGHRLIRPPARLPKPPLLALLLLAASFALYAPSLRAPFLFDDGTVVVENPLTADPGNFLPPLGPRDVGFLSFALDRAAWGLDPLPFHGVNVLLHGVNALLVFLLLRRVAAHLDPGGEADPPGSAEAGTEPTAAGASSPAGRNGRLALAAALLFLVHPLQTGAVSYVSQRFTSLCALFYFLSFLSYLAAVGRYRRGEPFLSRGHLLPYAGSVVSALLAMKTKEIAFTLPVMVLSWELLFAGKGAGRGERPVPRAYWIPFALSLLVVPAGYLSAPAGLSDVLREVGGASAETREIGRWEYLLTQARVLVTYGRLFLLPYGQSVDHDYALSRSLLEPALLGALALHALVAAASVRAYRLAAAGPLLLVPFGVAWGYVALSVESSLLPIRDVIFEHRGYLPFPGMAVAALAAARWGAERLAGERGRRALPALLAAALVLLSGLTVRRNLLWADGFALWRDAAGKAPAKARPRANLATLYQDRGMLAEAEGEYVAALRIDPNVPLLHNNLGNVLKLRGRPAEAIVEYRRALLLDPSFAEAHFGLGSTLAEGGRLAEALPHLEKALALQPGMAEGHVAIANVYDAAGRREEALLRYAEAIRLRPDLETAWYNRGLLRERSGDLAGARDDYRKALELSPTMEPPRARLRALGG